MKKKELRELLIDLAADAMDDMIECGGEFPQRAIVRDLQGNVHFLAMPGAPLHGRAMAEMLRLFAEHVGGADMIALIADGRFAITTKEEWEQRPDDYSIAKDEANREALMVSGRSHEHTALIVNPYRRTKVDGGKDTIVFDDSEPKIQEGAKEVNLVAIPNVWAKVN